MEIVLNFNNCDSISDLHEILMKEFNFPDYYGKNLDALYDCLTELDGNYDVEVICKKGGKLEKYIDEIIDVFKDIDNIEFIHVSRQG